MPRPIKIISGGQTGVDRAALDVALAMGIEAGGWCPGDRRDENGRIPSKYDFLVPTPQPAYLQRTRWNVRDSDATLLCHQGDMGPGTRATIGLCKEMAKPYQIIDMRERRSVKEGCNFLVEYGVKILNVAGPRESKNTGIHELAIHYLTCLMEQMR